MKVRNCTKWWGPNSHILIYYIEQSRKEIYLVTSAKGEWHSQAAWAFCAREEVAAAFEGFHPEVRKVIELAPQLTKWPILDINPIRAARRVHEHEYRPPPQGAPGAVREPGQRRNCKGCADEGVLRRIFRRA